MVASAPDGSELESRGIVEVLRSPEPGDTVFGATLDLSTWSHGPFSLEPTKSSFSSFCNMEFLSWRSIHP